jgi:hypothetical protein
VILGTVIALLAGMVFLVIGEAPVPSGSVPGPVYVLRAARGRVGRAGRYGQISRILARPGLLPYARGGRRSELATPEGRAAAGKIGAIIDTYALTRAAGLAVRRRGRVSFPRAAVRPGRGRRQKWAVPGLWGLPRW